MRLTRQDREQLDTLCTAVWNHTFQTVDCDHSWNGYDAGEIAQAAVDAIRAKLVPQMEVDD